MRHRPLGKTGLDVSELALGTWGLSGDAYGPVDPAEADRAIARALELGIDCFETAGAYGLGEMERAIGRAIRAPGPFDPAKRAVVVTKVGVVRGEGPAEKRFDPATLRDAVARSRDRVGPDAALVALLHCPAVATVTRGEATGTMAEIVASGAARAWGVSCGTTEVARAAMGQGAQMIEVAYNAIFSRDLHDLGGEVSFACAGVLARSVLAYGLLAGMVGEDRGFDASDHRSRRWTRAELVARLGQLRAVRTLLSSEVHTLRSAALRFVLSNQLVSTAVLGPRSALQLEQLVREAGAGPPYLTDAALARLPGELESAGLRP